MNAIEAEIAKVPLWRHRIPLPGGITTPGKIDTVAKLKRLALPEDLSGKRVLDVGCSDGGFSFECERRGASYVLAVDNYSVPFIDSPSGFNVAHRILNSRVDFQQIDFFKLDSAQAGQFDLILFLGVLYHLRHPLLALEHLADLCKGMLVVETLIARRQRGKTGQLLDRLSGDRRSEMWMEFIEHDEGGRNSTNWWSPSVACTEAMLRSCGFCGVKTIDVTNDRGVFHAFHPDQTRGAEELIERYGEPLVRQAFVRVIGHEIESQDDLAGHLRKISIRQFGETKQQAEEIRAKDWHQHGRWEEQV